MSAKIKLTITAFLYGLVSFVFCSVALAQGDNVTELAKPVFKAISDGQWLYAAALGLVLATALLRRFGGSRWPLLASKKAAPFFVLAISFFGAMATGLMADKGLSLDAMLSSAKVAVAAAGGYSIFKALLVPLKKISPLWLQPFFGLFDIILDSRNGAKLARAKKAGELAVKENPSMGIDLDFKDME